MHLTLLGDDYIDDAAIKFQFEQQLGALTDSGATTAGEALRSQLAEERTLTGSALALARDASPPNKTNALERAKAATLVLGHIYKCDRCENWHSNLAGGVLLTEDGIALTNYHVMNFKDGAAFGAMLSDGRLFPIAKVLASSEKDDLALVQLDRAESLPFVTWRKSAKPGAELFVISHPDSHFYALTKGHLSRYSLSPKRKTKRIEITAPFARGSSGSGIFDQNGQLLGLVASTNTVFYHISKEEKTNPQLVFYNGIPTESFMNLLEKGKGPNPP